ncbi:MULTISPECIES: protein-L-isoaspartate O-methyltransferase family protein [Marivita]|uniref:Protein-L-isoaspartate O-methyltransferase n=1 Tax=Marivita cryptomonadis TaxID=505252 RepID=A0A9Q2P0V0_9RHOB|nr:MULTISPECIES: protein-L-isoaspartate O-methyltransferase [Marivita]MCR9167192.1 protein-L-isoaspartate O-methyltransferase [Paracoccaceae bacterium]MBM2320505.1 protein-L-isoaspartate O-methyltransferase [Marivita cryptomonadis]MBM2330085.1 protein-L-isoaspartate O-methyltransferase [Marivita cryptomonadis]MBM2339672.1 protein-L-isoaspartate O-methyltransferase [Marivita cryptomonadis]MBM2344331.1 protein-L-isoaspartate O-methyltransferase [Marivita cryptomonadis]
MTDFAARRTMMVDTQVRPSDVTKFPIIDAMLSVPRELFVPREQAEAAYISENVPIAPGRVVLEPRTLGKLLDALNIESDELVLDIGAGYGYSSALVARMAEAVIAVEEDEALASEAQVILSEQGADNVVLHTGLLTEGAAQHGPYDAMLIEGGVEQVPDALLEQLKDGGRIGCVFMEGALGVVRIGYKIDGNVTWRFAFNASAPVLLGFAKKAAFTL